jgi:hypothetical protein
MELGARAALGGAESFSGPGALFTLLVTTLLLVTMLLQSFPSSTTFGGLSSLRERS